MSEDGLETVSSVDTVANQIINRILSGEFSPGMSLTGHYVAVLTDVSLQTARLAIAQLINQGYLVQQPHYPAGIRLVSASELKSVLEVGWLLELEAVRECVERKLTGSLSVGLDLADPSIGDCITAETGLHYRLVQAAFNPALATAFASLVGPRQVGLRQQNWSVRLDTLQQLAVGLEEALEAQRADLATDQLGAYYRSLIPRRSDAI